MLPKVYYIRGSAGDIIYSLPAIREASGGGIIINGMPVHLHNALKPLIDLQKGFQLEHENSIGIPANVINLEDFRHLPTFRHEHIAESFARILKVVIDLHQPWLDLSASSRKIWFDPMFSIVNITPRYRDSLFSWRNEIRILKQQGDVIFIGTNQEYKPYRDLCGYLHSQDYLEAAHYISQCKHYSGSQSACLAIAEGLGRSYRYVRNVASDNTYTGRANETVLNKYTRKLHFTLARLKEIKEVLIRV